MKPKLSLQKMLIFPKKIENQKIVYMNKFQNI